MNDRFQTKKNIIKKILLFIVCLTLSAAFFVPAAAEETGTAVEETGTAAVETGTAAAETESAEAAAFAEERDDQQEENYDIDPVAEGEGYSAVLYNNTNGLPTAESNAIAQTSEGFIWIGSYSGLVRYDGNTFERLDVSSGIKSVTCLFVDSHDRLWIGTNDSGVAVMERGEFTKWNKSDGLPASPVRAIQEDKNGLIYVATTAGVVMFDQDLNLCFPEDERLAATQVSDLKMAEDGTIYGVTNTGDIFSIKDREVVYYVDHEKEFFNGIGCLLPDVENPGMLYFGTGGSWLLYGDPEADLDNIELINIEPLTQVQELKYIGDQLWICAHNGIGVINEDGFHQLINLPMDNSVNHIMMDYEGNLWFTSSRQGVMKIVSNPFLDLFARYKLSEMVVNATCKYDDRLFVGTDDGLAVIGKNGPVTNLPVTVKEYGKPGNEVETDLLSFLSGCRIRSITCDSKNRLWIATWRSFGLLCYDQDTLYMITEGLFSDRIRAVFEREDGSFLVAETGGVSVLDDFEGIASYGEEDGIGNTEILTVTEGPDGSILAGSDGGGIYVIKDSDVWNIGENEGLESEVVMRIKKDRFRDIYWIVTGNSIAYMTEDYQIVTVDKFPYSNNFDLYQNSKDEMWVISSNGLYITPTENMIRNDSIEPLLFNMANGLPCIATANSYSELTEEGDLYISGNTGVAKVNIEKPIESSNNLKMAVPFIEADEEVIYPDQGGSFTIPSGVRKLTIFPFVFSYSLSNPLVAYQLKGLEPDFENVNTNELRPIDYTNLPGGEYEFIMELRDPAGQGTKTISVKIIKEKALYEYVWFYIIIGLLIALCVTMIFRAYVRKRVQMLEKKHQEEAEKNRISMELRTAARIQNSMLPQGHPVFSAREEFDVFATMEPAREVGGDFYDYFLIDEDHLGIVIADVSGKGIPAALFMMVSKVILQSCAMLGKSAEETIRKTNEAICSNNKMEMFVTVWFGILEISTGLITAANAGHEYPVLKQNGQFELFKDPHGLVIGGMPDAKYREYSIRLKPGDKLFLYTDGVAEAMNQENELFGTTRLLEALNRSPEKKPQEVLSAVREAVNLFVGEEEQFDDLTMLCLEYKGMPGSTEEEKSIDGIAG